VPTIGRGVTTYSGPGRQSVHVTPIVAHDGRYTAQQIEQAFRDFGLQPVTTRTQGPYTVLSFARRPAVLTAYVSTKGGSCLAVCVYPPIRGASLERRGNVGIRYSRTETGNAHVVLTILR
jgi:hypothetical protein